MNYCALHDDGGLAFRLPMLYSALYPRADADPRLYVWKLLVDPDGSPFFAQGHATVDDFGNLVEVRP